MSDLPQSQNKTPGIKRAFYPLPEENPDGWRCVEVHIPDGDEYMELLRTALKSLTLWFNYARDVSHRGKVIADRFAYALQLPELGCDMNCEELMACLAPMVDQLNQMQEAIDTALEKIEAIEENISTNAAKPPAPLPALADCLAIYPGALALVKEMNKNNQKYYTEAEASFVDNASEALSILIELFPQFAGQTYDEGFELGNAYFENQVTAYNLAYPAFEPLAACDLMRKIILAGGELTIDVWGDWLFTVNELIPDNAAGNVFTKYSPLRQTFLNQIAELFNQEQSLKSYFDDLWQVYYAGTQAPVEELPEGCDCLVFAEPIISEDWTGYNFGGTNMTDLGGGLWEATSTAPLGAAWGLQIQDVLDRVFVLSDISYPDGIPAICAQSRYDGIDHSSCFGGTLDPQYDRFGWTWNAGTGAQRVRFRIFLAE